MNDSRFRELLSLAYLWSKSNRFASHRPTSARQGVPVGRATVYGISMALKALTQTIWMKGDEQDQRREVHFTIGSRRPDPLSNFEGPSVWFPNSKSDVHEVIQRRH
jgi:hypothetical protein